MRVASFSTLGVVLALTLTSCERDELVGVDPGSAPGRTSPTLEALLSPDDLPGWVDSVFTGFANAGNATYVQVEEGTPELMSRGLFRYSFIQDSVFILDTISVARGFDSARVVLNVDTSRSVLASSGTTLQLRAVGEAWDENSASWEFAVDTPGVQTPWSGGPGGTLGVVLSELTLTEFPDSLVFPLDERSDSLLRLWNDTARVNTGVALVVSDSGRIVVTNSGGGLPRLHYNLIPELQPDTAIEFRVFGTAETFIFDRSPLMLPVGQLRVGGVDGARIFTRLGIPDSVTVFESGQRRRLRGSTINKAELVLVSLEPPEPPFVAEALINVSAFELADEFLSFGAKTPVGSPVTGSDVIIDPDSLEAGESIRIDITRLLQAWSDVPTDSVPRPVRFVVRADPEATTFGFWPFGSAEASDPFAPILRIVFTPPIEFEVP